MRYSYEELKEILKEHEGWLSGLPGSRMYLSKADLQYANFYRANLSHAQLCISDLRFANLSQANLYCADLRGADLSYSCLQEADLFRANLRGANLSQAIVYKAILFGTHMDKTTIMPDGKPWCFGIDFSVYTTKVLRDADPSVSPNG